MSSTALVDLFKRIKSHPPLDRETPLLLKPNELRNKNLRDRIAQHNIAHNTAILCIMFSTLKLMSAPLVELIRPQVPREAMASTA